MEIWHNPRCTKSRQAMALLQDAGIHADIRRYLDDPPSADELRRVLGLLGIDPWDLVRMNEPGARDLGMGDWDHDDPEQWIEAMVAHPRLIERPVVIEGDRAVIGRPTERIHELLT